MEASKLTRKIRSQTSQIAELEQFQGRTVEIIILAPEQAPGSKSPSQQKKLLGGCYRNIRISPYGNKNQQHKGEQAWSKIAMLLLSPKIF